MPKKTSSLAKSISKKLALLEATRARVEALLLSGHLSVEDVEQVYAGLFLDAFTEFEGLLEDLFLGIVSGSHKSAVPTTKRRVKIVPIALTQEICFEGRAYLDWLPIDKYTTKRAGRFLDNGEPFSRLTKDEEKTIERLHLLRNAVAHKSDNAKHKFEVSIQAWPLLPQEKTPAGFLRSKPQGPAGFNQYQIGVSQLETIAQKICA
jgi:hypothetical protein